MENEVPQLALPETPVLDISKMDSPVSEANLNVSQPAIQEIKATEEVSADFDDNTKESGPVVEIVVQSDVSEENNSSKPQAKARIPLEDPKAVTESKSSAITITTLRKDSGETTTVDLEQGVTIPESKSDISQHLRVRFIRKVLFILFSQVILISLIVGLVFLPGDKVKNAIQSAPAAAIVTVLISVLSLLILVFKRSALRKVPWNYLLLFTFTCSTSYSLAYLASFTESTIVLISAIFTLVIIIGATVVAWRSRSNGSKLGYFLYQVVPLSIALAIAGVALSSQIVQVAISAGIALIFSIHLTYNIQRLIGNFENKYSLDDYILAALDIYIDVYVIFVETMKLAQNVLRE